jgi:hypothetical protein
LKWVPFLKTVRLGDLSCNRRAKFPNNSDKELPGEGFMLYQGLKMMTKENLVETITKILKTDGELDFLLKLAPRELEILLVCLRGLADQEKR